MNVILLGGSNSVMGNGLQKGIRLGIDELNANIERACNERERERERRGCA